MINPNVAEIENLFGGDLRFEKFVREDTEEVVAQCWHTPTNRGAIVHLMNDLPQNLRIHIEFETSQLRTEDIRYLSRVVATSFDGSKTAILREYEEGLPAEEYINQQPVDMRNAVALAKCLFRGLNELEELGVQHLDLCSRNFLVSPGGVGRVVRSSYLPPREEAARLESALCCSPEQAGAIQRDTTAASDLYSAGVLFYLLLTGHYPFSGDNVNAVLMGHMTSTATLLSKYNPAAPSVLEEIVERLLKKDPAERYQTASAVLHDLDLLSDSLARGVSAPKFRIGTADRRAEVIEPSLVGRDTELAELSAGLEETNRVGDNSLLFFEGVSGSGKTKVLFNFSKHAVERGWNVFRGLCIQETSRQSLTAMRGVVERFSYCAKEADFAERFTAAFDAELADLQIFFPEIDLTSLSQGSSTQGPMTEQRTLRTLSSFINSIGTADQPALLVLDDCQWADDLTLKLIEHWWKRHGKEKNHVAVMLVFRGDEVVSDHQIRLLKPTSHTKLEKLSDQNIRTLAESMAGSLPSQVLDLVVTVAGGSPFMASAVVRGLVEYGAITRTEGTWQIHQDEFERCLSSSHAGEFLIRRLERFDAHTVEILSAAAVLGREFEIDTVAHLSGQQPNEVIQRINRARDRNILWYQSRRNRYIFSHDKIREALLHRLPASDVATMHRLTAEHLKERSPTIDSDVAFHYDAAGASTDALPYAFRAAQKALEQSKFSTAKTQFRIAQRSISYASVKQKYQIESGLGKVLMERGEYDDVEQHFHRAAGYASNDLENAQAMGNLAEIQRRRGDLGGARKTYLKSLGILRVRLPSSRMGTILCLLFELVIRVLHMVLPSLFVGRARRVPNTDERLALRLFSGLTHSNVNGNSILQSLYTHVRSINLAEKFRPSPELALLYLEHASAWAFMGRRWAILPYSNSSLAISDAPFPSQRDGLIAHYLSIAFYCTAQYDKAILHGRQAIESLERVGDYWKIHMARYQLAAALYQKGYYREAIAEAKKNYESGVEKGDYQASGIILDVWARSLPGDLPDELIEAEFSRGRDDHQGNCQMLIAQTANLIGQKKFDEAIHAADEAKRLLFSNLLVTPYPYAILAWSIAALRSKAESLGPLQARERKQILRRALNTGLLGIVHSLIQPIEKPRLYREIAMVLLMQGNEWASEWFLRASVYFAQRQSTELDYAESLLLLGQLRDKKRDPRAAAMVDEAKSKLNRLKLEHGPQVVRRDIEATGTTLSLIDRFDTLLNVGRKITTALREHDVLDQTRQAAMRLLRSKQCVVVRINDEVVNTIAGPTVPIDQQSVFKAKSTNQTVVSSSNERGSIICTPISVHGEKDAYLYGWHPNIRNMFGDDEKRLSEFIATLAGASLENAVGYQQLQELNLTLEDRVAERTQAAESRAQELVNSNRELERTATDLRITEEQLREAVVEANAASESKSRFLATMSHEIRTPMNGILGMTELAMATELNPAQTKYLKVVKQSGQLLLNLLNEILDLSKIEAGKMEIENIEFEIREAVETAVQLFSHAAHENGLEIVCDLDLHVPLYVKGDPTRIRQILVNLIGNAIKFTSQGEIHVSVRCGEKTNNQPSIVFAVRDTGIGIAPEKQDAIFEAFQQEDSSTTREYGGTGLGLSICQQLATLMHGEITLKSVQSEGSTFELRLPLEPVGLETQHDLAEDQLRGNTMLLISRRPTVSAATQAIFGSLGLSVLAMNDINELESDMVAAIDLVTMDEPSDADIEKLKEWEVENVIALSKTQAPTTDESHVLWLTKPLGLAEARAAAFSTLQLVPRETTESNSVEDQLGSPEAPPNVTARPVTSTIRILVADDCEVNQEVARGLLELEGFDVEVAETGEQAVEKAEGSVFDLVLMDVEMPVMDGIEATKRIRGFSDVPVIALSAHGTSELERRLKGKLFDAFLSKPIQPTELVATIHKFVESASSRCASSN